MHLHEPARWREAPEAGGRKDANNEMARRGLAMAAQRARMVARPQPPAPAGVTAPKLPSSPCCSRCS